MDDVHDIMGTRLEQDIISIELLNEYKIRKKNYIIINEVLYQILIILKKRFKKFLNIQNIDVVKEKDKIILTLPYNLSIIFEKDDIYFFNGIELDSIIMKGHYIIDPEKMLKLGDDLEYIGLILFNYLKSKEDESIYKLLHGIPLYEIEDKKLVLNNKDKLIDYIFFQLTVSLARYRYILYNKEENDDFILDRDEIVEKNYDDNALLKLINIDKKFIGSFFLGKVREFMNDNMLNEGYYNHYYDKTSDKYVLLTTAILVDETGKIVKLQIFQISLDVRRFKFYYETKILKPAILKANERNPDVGNIDSEIYKPENLIVVERELNILYDKKKDLLYPVSDQGIAFVYADRIFEIVGRKKSVVTNVDNPNIFETVSSIFVFLNEFINIFRIFFKVDSYIADEIPYEKTINYQSLFFNPDALLAEEPTVTKETKTIKQFIEKPDEHVDERVASTAENPEANIPNITMIPYMLHFRRGLITLKNEGQWPLFLPKISNTGNVDNRKTVHNDTRCLSIIKDPNNINPIHLTIILDDIIRGQYHFTNELLKHEIRHFRFSFKYSDAFRDILLYIGMSPINIEIIVQHYIELLAVKKNLSPRGELMIKTFGMEKVIEVMRESLNELYNFYNSFIKDNYLLFKSTEVGPDFRGGYYDKYIKYYNRLHSNK